MRTSRFAQLGWVILPLRGFLSVVFLYAGISKIADRRFLDGSSPISIHATVVAVRHGSPIGWLLGPAANHSYAFGLAMLFAEIAVGLGLVLGLFTRIAAAGGMLITLSLWLSVSWQSEPWFTGADVVYFFALTPLLIGGSAGVLSLDAWLDEARERRPGVADDRTRRAVLAGGAALLGAVIAGGSALFRRSPASASAAPPAPSPGAGDGVRGSGRHGQAGSRSGHRPRRLGAAVAGRTVHGLRLDLSASGLFGGLRLAGRRIRLPLPRLAVRRHRAPYGRSGAERAQSDPGVGRGRRSPIYVTVAGTVGIASWRGRVATLNCPATVRPLHHLGVT